MRSWLAAAVVVVSIATAFACASFDTADGPGGPAAADSGPAAADGAAGSDGAAGTDGGSGSELCTVAFAESFDGGFGLFPVSEVTAAYATLDAPGGVLVAHVQPAPASAQAQAVATLALDANVRRLKVGFTLRDVKPFPDGYVWLGCTVRLVVRADTYTQIIFRLNNTALALKDGVDIDNVSVAILSSSAILAVPQAGETYAVRLDLVIADDGKSVTSTAALGKGATPTRTPPLGGHPTSLELKCGIDEVSYDVDAGAAPITVTVDDVTVETCAPSP
jgi:hypothetical protein